MSTEARPPLAVGTAVWHASQQWAARLPGGTAIVKEVQGPLLGGLYEYRVLTAQDFSRRPGRDNPMVDLRWWSSSWVMPAKRP